MVVTHEVVERDLILGVHAGSGIVGVRFLAVVDGEILGSVVAELTVVHLEHIRALALARQRVHGAGKTPGHGLAVAVENERVAVTHKHAIVRRRFWPQMVGVGWPAMHSARCHGHNDKQ